MEKHNRKYRIGDLEGLDPWIHGSINLWYMPPDGVSNRVLVPHFNDWGRHRTILKNSYDKSLACDPPTLELPNSPKLSI